MLPVNFPEANIVYQKPDGWTDEQCSDLSAFKGVTAEGLPFINTLWQPSKEDIENIRAGRPILLSIHCYTMIPVSLATFNEAGEIEE